MSSVHKSRGHIIAVCLPEDAGAPKRNGWKTNVLAGLSLLGWCGVTGDLRLPAPLIWKHTEHHTQAGGDTRKVTNKQLQILLSWNLISVVLKRTGYVKVSLSLAVVIVIILLQKFLEQKLKKNFSLLQKTLTTHQYL